MNSSGSPAIGAVLIIGLVVALVCGLISSTIAKNKGLPAAGYFFLGFLLGIIGIVIAAVVRPAETGTTRSRRLRRRAGTPTRGSKRRCVGTTATNGQRTVLAGRRNPWPDQLHEARSFGME